jgi:hypothetical protein
MGFFIVSNIFQVNVNKFLSFDENCGFRPQRHEEHEGPQRKAAIKICDT